VVEERKVTTPPPLPPVPQQQLPPPPAAPFQLGPAKRNVGVQAAQASWMAPLVGIALNVLSSSAVQKDRVGLLVVGLSSFAIYILGLCCGIFALTRIRKYGRAGILAPAITGVSINGVLVAIFCVVFLALYILK
jgi:hypothetical protein